MIETESQIAVGAVPPHDVDADPAPATDTGLVISFEALAYIALAAIAGAMRLVQLDWLPLDARESAIAAPAWAAIHGATVERLPAEPLAFHLARLSLWLLGGGEAQARLAAVVFGVVIVLLAARLRPAVGRPAALAVAALFAMAPLWTFYGRTLSSTMISAAAIVLLIGALANRTRADRGLVPFAAALALAAGGVTYAFLIGAAAFAVLEIGRGHGGELRAFFDELWPEHHDRRRAGIVFVLTLVLAATGLLTRPDGFGAMLEGVASWAQGLGGVGTGFFGGVLLPLFVNAPVMTLFGIAGMAIALRDGDRPGLFLVLWTVAALVVAFLAGSPDAVASLLLPLALGAGVALGRLAERLAAEFTWSEDGVMTGILLIVLGYALIQGFAYADATDTDPMRSAGMLVLGALLMSVLLVAVYAVLWGVSLAVRVTGVAAVIAFGLFALAGGSQLNYADRTDLREPMRPRFVTSQASDLAATLASASWAATRDPNELATIAEPGLRATLAWPLRDRVNMSWAEVQGDIDAGAAVVESDGEAAEFGPAAYVGQHYAVSGEWLPVFDSRQSFARWLLQRRPPHDLAPYGDIVFERADLYVRVE